MQRSLFRQNMGSRQRKIEAGRLLDLPDSGEALKSLEQWPPMEAANALIPHLCSPEAARRIKAASALGDVAVRLAAERREAARELFRRLMWHLNEESGGMGWGVPEAMAEILARDKGLAREFGNILVSYATQGGNLLDHPDLFRQAVWAVARLARTQPGQAEKSGAGKALAQAAGSGDPTVRGYAAWGLSGPGNFPEAREALETLAQDPAPFLLPGKDGPQSLTVARAAAGDEKINQGSPPPDP